MSFNGLFTTGVSALRAQARNFETISDNIAKTNLPGYKFSEVQTRISSAGGSNPFGQLNGTGTNIRTRFDSDGQAIVTEEPLDAALVGKGFFITSDKLSGGDMLLTEAGQFRVSRDTSVDTSSYLTDPTGHYVMGWEYDPQTETFATGTTEDSLGAIRIDRLSDVYEAVGSSYAKVSANLDADSTTGSNHKISFNILDGTGSADDVSDDRYIEMSFTKTATADLWDVTFSAEDGVVNTAPIQLQFDATGSNVNIVGQTDAALDFSVDWSNPTASTNFPLNLNEFTQFSGGHVLNEIASDGYNDGLLVDVYFGEEGILQGAFSNGVTRPIAKIAIGDVPNPGGLYSAGSTHFAASRDSGDLIILDPEVTTRAIFVAGSYEASSANINTEFTKLIQSQHAYSSAATTIRTIDEMLQTANKMK